MTASLNINPPVHTRIRKNVYQSALASLYRKKERWNELNDDRRAYQREKKLDKERLSNKKLYAIYGKKYYKLIGDDGDYYVLEDALKNLPASQFKIDIYKYSFTGMEEDRVQMKVDKEDNNIYISTENRGVNFKLYKIESIMI